MKVSLIAAVAQNGVIGRDNDLPWQIEDDMKFFRETTRGHVVVTGRKNFEAMGGPLPKRPNIVVTRDEKYLAKGAEVRGSVERALALAQSRGEQEAFVIGGAQIYELALPYAHQFYRTRVLADVPGDVTFPEFDESEWDVAELRRHAADERNEHPFVIEVMTRRTMAKPIPTLSVPSPPDGK